MDITALKETLRYELRSAKDLGYKVHRWGNYTFVGDDSPLCLIGATDALHGGGNPIESATVRFQNRYDLSFEQRIALEGGFCAWDFNAGNNARIRHIPGQHPELYALGQQLAEDFSE